MSTLRIWVDVIAERGVRRRGSSFERVLWKSLESLADEKDFFGLVEKANEMSEQCTLTWGWEEEQGRR